MLPGPTPPFMPGTKPCASPCPAPSRLRRDTPMGPAHQTWPTGPQRSAGNFTFGRFRPRHQQHRRLPSLPLHQRAAE